ncbi:2,3-diaminopropionate biosynthesis protein SbnB [Streptomyces aidingensis]|uniref:Ornithine cyclodeaminase n=1 Tax=Streptomyces aidingensis TaxID=910347 RepID=A0A1I1KAR0_9ACTN|nr:2,3-diaminopropionate biosynthesis protein SbnB [Streptomyces aidingensis]SFC58007.1 ornithine cyclodeaminase [Streptomyces aidingensis]
MLPFHIMGGKAVRAVIGRSRPRITAAVDDAYRAHHRGDTVNPDSYFMRFPDKPEARIIALPALLRGTPPVAGLKWIGSFPANVAHNLPRASAVLILNDFGTGYPFACLEASQISAARTAASAALAAGQLHGTRRADRVAVVGAGVISRTVLEFLRDLGWTAGDVVVHDTVPDYAGKAAQYARELGFPARTGDTLRGTCADADVVVLATTATVPYITEPGFFAPGQTVLNISLRDIGPELIADAHNILDDVEHCLRAGTSPHLAVEKFGTREFIDGTLTGLTLGEFAVGRDKPLIFSPFGLGVLDIAVGVEVLAAGRADGTAQAVADFFEESRW